MAEIAENNTTELKKLSMDKVFCYIAMALFVSLPIGEIINEVMVKNKVKFGKTYLYPSYFQPYIVAAFGILITALVLVSFVLRIAKKNFKFYVADVFYFTLMIFMLLSMIFSVNFGVFAGGNFYYSEHPFHFLCYYGLFYCGSMIADSKLRKNLLCTYFVVAVIQGVVAFLQTFRIEISYCLFYNYRASRVSAYGLLQNTNFYGALSLVLVIAVAGLFVFSSVIFEKQIFKWICYPVALLVFYTMLASNSRLAWLGFAGAMFTYLISLIVMRKSNMDKDKLKKITIDFVIMAIGFVVILLIAFFFTNYIVGRLKVTAEDTLQRVGQDGFGHGRGRIWKAALHSVPRHWVNGIGLDNLAQCFREMPGWKPGDYVQDKGHNEYLHTLATQGIFAIVNYVALLIYAAVTTVKKIFKETDDVKRCLQWIFLTVFAAYVCQAALNSSVMNVAPYFWIILGLCTSREKPISFKKR
ncbi:MAG: O-antigen ligase family protein [Clostridiales bacterium]|nr:O-antigen ligase family protein [Clostridiales bacterium]